MYKGKRIRFITRDGRELIGRADSEPYYGEFFGGTVRYVVDVFLGGDVNGHDEIIYDFYSADFDKIIEIIDEPHRE